MLSHRRFIACAPFQINAYTDRQLLNIAHLSLVVLSPLDFRGAAIRGFRDVIHPGSALGYSQHVKVDSQAMGIAEVLQFRQKLMDFHDLNVVMGVLSGPAFK